MQLQKTISFIRYLGAAVLNSYGMLFFSKNKTLSILILLVSFITPIAGLTALLGLVISLVTAHALGFGREQIKNGLITYSVVLFGLGYATNFETGFAYYLLLIIGSLVTLFISITLNARLNKHGLPALSLAFIFSTWIIILATKSFTGIGVTQRHIYWFNEAYALGGNSLVSIVQKIENWPFPAVIAGFFRSMSAILFQVNIATGIILSIGLLIFSRIGLVLMILGYTIALIFSNAMGAYNQAELTYYNMGTNFMLVAVALGGFYVIPSIRSFFWLLITVPIAFLLVVSLGWVFFRIGVPVFSFPFCIVVILFIHVLQLRNTTSKLVLTPVQYYSPEQNLYRYLNGKARLMHQIYQSIQLPFMGEWMVSQGYNGSMTHRGEWSKALDFVLLDEELKTYQLPGTMPEHFYCYNRPVLSPADGIVEEIIDHIDDNEIGQNNTQQNWGNSIVIKHAEGLYSKISHLKKHSFKTTKGAYVKQGEVIAACGNSGRSPEPHVHFQIQTTPYVGSKTTAYPIAGFIARNHQQLQFVEFGTPREGNFVSNPNIHSQLLQAFNFQPGFCMTVTNESGNTEEWEVLTTYYNESYFYCSATQSYAYFKCNKNTFSFTNYFGNRNTLLYQFYLAAYKILLSTEKPILVQDELPINSFGLSPLRWLQDIVAPFYVFLRMRYLSQVKVSTDQLGSGKIEINSTLTAQYFWNKKTIAQSNITVEKGCISQFKINKGNQQISIVCKPNGE